MTQVIVAAGGLVLVILLSVPWLNGPLKKIGFTNPGQVSQAILTFVAVSIFFEVRGLSASKPVSQRNHFSDPLQVYPVLLEHARATTRRNEKVLDVLGLTLYTAWPSFRFWLSSSSDLDGWTMRFTAISDDDGKFSAYIPNSHLQSARSNLDSIVQYASSPEANARRVTVKAYAYSFMPSLHGFRLGNGDLFYSILHWQPDGQLCLDNFSYEFVSREDHSKSAEAIRQTFDSWFQRTTATEWQGPALRQKI